MNASLLKSMIPVAVGAGVMIGAAGVFLYDQFFREKRRILLQKEVANLDFCITELKRELESLKRLQKAARKKKTGPPTVVSEPETEVFSVYDEEQEEEFYDFSESEDEGLADAKREALGSKYDDLDALLEGNGLDLTSAYGILLDMLDKTPNDPDILWRLAKVCHAISGNVNIETDIPKRQDFLNKGVSYAEECLKLAPRSSDAHKWFAICIGARSQNLSTKEKVKDGIEFKKHVEKALELDPEDATLHHLLGRFKFEFPEKNYSSLTLLLNRVATLSWFERKVASTLFGDIPEASYEETMESLFRAEELSSDPWKENRLLIAKCYLNLNDIPTGISWLNKAKEIDTTSPEDRVAEAEIKILMEKYQNF